MKIFLMENRDVGKSLVSQKYSLGLWGPVFQPSLLGPLAFAVEDIYTSVFSLQYRTQPVAWVLSLSILWRGCLLAWAKMYPF